MATSGKKRWPRAGRNRWPLTGYGVLQGFWRRETAYLAATEHRSLLGELVGNRDRPGPRLRPSASAKGQVADDPAGDVPRKPPKPAQISQKIWCGFQRPAARNPRKHDGFRGSRASGLVSLQAGGHWFESSTAHYSDPRSDRPIRGSRQWSWSMITWPVRTLVRTFPHVRP
jgi:hypothetical protein